MFSMKTLAFQYRNFKQRSTGNDFITQARGPEADRQTNRQLLVDGTNRRQTCQDSRRPQSHNTVLAPQAALQAGTARSSVAHRATAVLGQPTTPLVRRNHPTRPAAEGGLDNNLSQDPSDRNETSRVTKQVTVDPRTATLPRRRSTTRRQSGGFPQPAVPTDEGRDLRKRPGNRR